LTVSCHGHVARLRIPLDAQIKTLSKGTKEKVQLVMVMSRRAELYLLDEPIAGVDPAHAMISSEPSFKITIATHR
jgi:ABC-2 type transport system ATP-binding protein